MVEQSPALRHLRLAKAYLDDAIDTKSSDGTASSVTSQFQLEKLSNAARHLNQARELDPAATLPFEDKTGSVNISQDYLNARVLTAEGVAHYNTAFAAKSEYDKHMLSSGGKHDYNSEMKATTGLHAAKNAFEQALKYNPTEDDALKFLSKTYLLLADRENAQRVLERRIELKPDDIDALKELDTLEQTPQLKKLAQKPPYRPGVVFYCLIVMLVSIVAAPISVALQFPFAGIFALTFVGSIVVLVLKWWSGE